eukprot:6179156-Pleurochrysis_carterae.AAC.1
MDLRLTHGHPSSIIGRLVANRPPSVSGQYQGPWQHAKKGLISFVQRGSFSLLLFCLSSLLSSTWTARCNQRALNAYQSAEISRNTCNADRRIRQGPGVRRTRPKTNCYQSVRKHFTA